MDQSGRGRPLSQAGTTRWRTVQFPDRAAAPQVMRGRYADWPLEFPSS